jgi:hypothetical protein
MKRRDGLEDAPNDPRHLHEQAVFGRVALKVRLANAKEAYEGYDNDLDKGRAARDIAKLEFLDNDPHWQYSIQDSLKLLKLAREGLVVGSPDEMAVTREESASYGMLGRLILRIALETNDLAAYSLAAEYLKWAHIFNKQSSRGAIRPDQYEVNFAFARAMAERYASGYGAGLQALGRTALIAGTTETFARHRNTSLSRQERKQARRRSRERLWLTASLVLAPGFYTEREAVREKAARLVI